MRKNYIPIFFNVTSKSHIWKLGFFFSIIPFLFSSLLFASDQTNSQKKTSEEKFTLNPNLHISEGTIIYGAEMINDVSSAQNTPDRSKNLKKTLKKIICKNSSRIVDNVQKIKYPPQKISLVYKIFLKEPQEIFNNFKNSGSFSMVSANYNSKAILDIHFRYSVAIFPTSIKSLYRFLFFISDVNASYGLFTRPPPDFSLI